MFVNFNPDQLFSFLENSIAAFSRQTVAVSPFAFMTDDSIQALYRDFEKNYDSENALPLSQLYKSGHSRLELNIKGKKGKTGKLVFFVDYNNYIFPENRNIELTDKGHLTDFKNIVYNYIWTIPYDVYVSRFEKIVTGYFPK